MKKSNWVAWWWSVMLVGVVGGLVAAAQPRPNTKGSVVQLGHIDGGTIPAASTVPGGMAYEVTDKVIYWSNGTAWAQVGAGSSSSSEITTLEDQSTAPVWDGGTNIQLYSQSIGPCGVPFYVGASGAPKLMMASAGPGQWQGFTGALSGMTALTTLAIAPAGGGASQVGTTFTIGGSYHQTLTSGSIRTTSTADNSTAFIRAQTTSPYFRGLDDGGTYKSGGFLAYLRGGIGSTDANQRAFFGLYGSNSPIPNTTDPSAATDTVYVGCDAADTNMSICSNDASGAATCATLGASFPCKAYGYYDFWFCAPPAGTSIGYYVRRLDTGTETAGTLSSDLPTANAVLYPQLYVNNSTGGTAAILLDNWYWMHSLQ